jgi:hypothetical protein
MADFVSGPSDDFQKCRTCTNCAFGHDFKEFETSAQQGCAGCRVIISGIGALVQKYGLWADPKWASDIWIQRASEIAGTVYFGSHERGLFGIEIFGEDAESDGDQRQLPRCRHIHSSPASQTGLDLGMQSLQHCITQHEACAATDARLPKRLIDTGLVGTDCASVSVFETHRSQEFSRARSELQYTILSYC